jgi:hypothetical protein
VPEGDISAAYCAESFPKIKVFTHEGKLFTNGGGHFSGPVGAGADCYLLIPANEYRGPDLITIREQGRRTKHPEWRRKSPCNGHFSPARTRLCSRALKE